MIDDPFHPDELDRLLACEAPLLIGVRHHSAALARATPKLLDRFQPKHLYVELPVEFQPWTSWLGNEELTAPVALASCDASGELNFYPFADFSPELAAIRWAVRNNVPVTPFDLPMTQRIPRHAMREDPSQPRGLLEQIYRRTQTDDVGALWDRLVESRGVDSQPEDVRRAGLLFGWALRSNDAQASAYDRLREGFMREALSQRREKSAAIIGSYHAAALLPEPMLWSPVETAGDPTEKEAAEPTTALIPYSFEQFDERSGYPAGVRDPSWHQRVWEANSADEVDEAAADFVVAVCRRLREAGHPFNAADGKEVLRMARDLAMLRDLPAPGRAELIEALQTCLTHGEVWGLGRAVAQAMESELVGSRRGALPGDAPRSGLPVDVERLLNELNLPRPGKEGDPNQRLRLDPLRSRLDRARIVVLERLALCGVPYGKLVESEESSAREPLTQVWQIEWRHSTTAMLELSAARGATLEQAARGALAPSQNEEEPQQEAAHLLARLDRAAHCGLTELVENYLGDLYGEFLLQAGLDELARSLELVERIRRGHVPGLPLTDKDARPPHVRAFKVPETVTTTPLLQAAIARLEGLTGSDDESDVAALLELVLWFQQQRDENSIEGGRLRWLLRDMAANGSPLMQGASWACLLLLDMVDGEAFGNVLGGWLDAALDREARNALRRRLVGAVVVSAPRLASQPSCVAPLEVRITSLSDADFLKQLGALRGGFQPLTPAARERLLRSLLENLEDEDGTAGRDLAGDPEVAALRAQAEQAGRSAVEALMSNLDLSSASFEESPGVKRRSRFVDGSLSLPDRWRLVLGVQQADLPPLGLRAACSLDELYGKGSGEGSRRAEGLGAGRESPFPTVREWAGELGDLFGADVREEVLGQAAESGRAAAFTELDPDQVTPSVELLQQALSLKGALADSQLDSLRKLMRRVADELLKELATRVRPALVGFSTPRPTRRRTTRLDLPRTIRANLHTAHRSDDGRTQLVPERLIFRSRARRSMDWRIIFVVDVSGSMEASVIYSAMMSGIFASLPAVSVDFLAFSTKLIDFSDHVEDPLALLMEVQVGGGTHIAMGVRAARRRLRNPARTIVLLVTDFHEGWPVGELIDEVRALATSGAKCLGLAALNDEGLPCYHQGVARRVAGAGMPVAALSPSQLARWVGEQIR